jgi:aspartyl-tRNA(Asn)/glutamyl-tRNA(Gln) amidotransferase subunit A
MIPADLDIHSALALLRAGDLSSVALTQACLARIEEQRSLNAFITVTADEAFAAAQAADAARARGDWLGPLHGIPVSLKDLIDVRGIATTAASRVTSTAPAVADAPATSALRRAGAVLVGKCNLHEFAFGTTSEESAFGPVRHPRDPARSPGGSSGGSGVAVATGMSLASIGTDTGGSIRIPAAACGVVGLKAAYGEISCEGVVPLSLSLDHTGPLTRTVADAALVYEVLTGRSIPDAGAAAGVRGRRFGVLGGYFVDRLEPGVRDAFESACAALKQAGAAIEEVDLAHTETIAPVYLAIVFAEAAVFHAPTLESVPDRYSPGVRMRLEAGRYVLAEDYLRALRGREVLRAAFDGALGGVDALLTPTLPIEAPAIGTSTIEIDGAPEPVRNLMLRCTQPFNLTGHPAITIPCGRGSAGMPVGLQLVGRRDATCELLQVARACEPHVGRGAPG